jgi:hypothetical protein
VKRATALAALVLAAASRPAAADEPVTSRLYGTVRLDGGFAHDVDDAAGPTRALDAGNDGELVIHPRLTRIGIEITPDNPDSTVDLTGLIEADLGNGTGVLGSPRLRHAYVRASRGRFELLAGQSRDLASPLVPSVNGISMMWDAGNTGAFRPQLRVGAHTGGRTLRVRGAIAAGMPGAVDGKEVAAGVPVGQALIELEHERGRLGVWGHAGRDRLATPIAGNTRFAALLGGAHIQVQLPYRFGLRGEGYVGRNATDLRAGSGQAIAADGKGVRTRGGWAELTADIGGQPALGIGVDDPRDDDVADGGVRLNTAIWLSAHRRIWGAARAGIEGALLWTRTRGDIRREGRWSTIYLSLDW